MKLEEQVCSLELSKRLKELGVSQESYFTWVTGENVLDKKAYAHLVSGVQDYPLGWLDTYSAFTVAELGEMLPYAVETSKRTEDGRNAWFCIHPRGRVEMADTEADVRAKMLIYLMGI